MMLKKLTSELDKSNIDTMFSKSNTYGASLLVYTIFTKPEKYRAYRRNSIMGFRFYILFVYL